MLTLGFAPNLAGMRRRTNPTAKAAWPRKRTVCRAEGCFFRRVNGTSASQPMRCADTTSALSVKKTGLSDPILDQRWPVAGLALLRPLGWGMARNQDFSSHVTVLKHWHKKPFISLLADFC